MAAAAILNFWICIIFDVGNVFYIGVVTILPSLVQIGQMVEKWQHFFEIQDGGSRHLEFLYLHKFRC
jgi:hypothetical protein